MTLELRVLSGVRSGACERFEKSVVAVGRHPLSDFRFDATGDLDVSGRHAELREVGGVWSIHDVGSTNGTYVNGARITGAHRLADGDVIRFGANGPSAEVHLAPAGGEASGGSGAVAASPAAFSPAPLTVGAGAADSGAPAGPTPPRRDTTARIAAAVDAETRSMKRTFGIALAGVAAAGVVAFSWLQGHASARERELLALYAQSESASARLQRALAELGPRDSLFARELRQKTLGRAPDEATRQPRSRDSLRGEILLLRSLGAMDLPRVHDANDPAIAMVASDLDGTFMAGTAFGVTRSGLLITNRHVVQDESGQAARRVRVIFGNTREWLPARVVRASERDDLALLQVEGGGSYPVVAGVSRTGALARVGAPVASIGYPLAVDTPMEGSGLHVTARTTTSAGFVSKRLDDVIQIDSYAGKGSSGSPLFDVQGQVVGVIYGGAADSGGRIVYAVPAQRVAEFLGADGAAIVR